MRTVWTFPGQLTEYVGMTGGIVGGSRALAQALAAASDLVGEDIARIAGEGPEALLRRDDVAATAVVAVGAASAEELGRRGFVPDAILGYSLGLYSAATASGAIALEDALRIVITIAREGERRFPPGRMAMGFVTGLRLARLESELAGPLGADELAITNVNTPAQIVLAGWTKSLDAALETLRPEAMRCERLQISRPYHSPWMEPVAGAVADLVRTIAVAAPRVPLHDHRDGAPLETAEEVRDRLARQLVTRLDWNASVRALAAAGASRFVEMPPGSSTTRMVRWIERDVEAMALDQPEARERFLSRPETDGKTSTDARAVGRVRQSR